MRLWYLSHRRPPKAQARLHIRTVSPEPSLFAHIKYIIIFFGTNLPVSLNLGIQHQALKYSQVCSYDDPRLTFDLFTEMSTLVPYTFVREKA